MHINDYPENAPTQHTFVFTASELLSKAKQCLVDRAAVHDTKAERAMKATVDSFNAMYNTNLTELQGWMFMVLLKMSRSKGGNNTDDFIDMAAYAALGGESVL